MTLKSRHDTTRALIEAELALLQYQNYNPIAGTFEQAGDDSLVVEGMIDPATPFIQALHAAQHLMQKAKSTMDDIRSTVKRVSVPVEKEHSIIAKQPQYELRSIKFSFFSSSEIKVVSIKCVLLCY